ncbi:DEAD/DEAH box helicase [Jiulongibacter sediminis]|uniref:DEAD/DEAH box helicase n=1 Tax=Jiulongibacter sediminis TaxID=1605367 RepID=UPI0026F16F14|nr:DEAD/DEAH box helicase [Jiulongibacter sediminis]
MVKSTTEILQKLGIKELNQMQLATQEALEKHEEVVLLSPTGTGKTLAFLLPLLGKLNLDEEKIQALIIVPSRELAIQIETVLREIGSGFKVNAVYGGRAGSKDKIDLQHSPQILIGTPGRVADHIRRQNIETFDIQTLVLDEFDKSLEIGFEKEMREITEALPRAKRKILTSATQKVGIPSFLHLNHPFQLDFTAEKSKNLDIKVIETKEDQKLKDLVRLLSQIGQARGIIFCNFKDSIQDVSAFLEGHQIRHSLFYGGLEQIDRERALIRFRNGSSPYLLATDLAARGIDVPEINFIIHYEIPFKKEEFTHRNGRTARMHADGVAYILSSKSRNLPDFIQDFETEELKPISLPIPESKWETLFISGGRKDKISKGDIAGLFLKQGGLSNEQLGHIELKKDCAFVAVHKEKASVIIDKLNNSRLKKKKVRISILENQ